MWRKNVKGLFKLQREKKTTDGEKKEMRGLYFKNPTKDCLRVV